MSIDHWMMFSTFAEQDFFAYPTHDTYQGVIINANMAAYAPAGIAAFLLEKTAAKTRYVVDPLTHAFQHDPGLISNSEGQPKKSIKSLAEAYGDPIKGIVGKRPLLPRDLADEESLKSLVRHCVSYQVDHLSSYIKSSDAAKYLADDDVSIKPYAVVAPYFYVTETTLDEWLPVNIRAAELTVSNETGGKRFAAVVVSQGVAVDADAREKLHRAFSKIALDGFFVWIDNLDEQSASGAELRGLRDLCRGLRLNGQREVINLHGGYFSILAAGALGNSALSGVAHGPEFGESRSVVPVGGGIPISRYYIPDLHARVRYRDALAMFRSKKWLDSAEGFYANVCNCDECRSTLEGAPANFGLFGDGTVKSVKRRHGLVRIEFPTSEAKQRCLRHYLQRKKREYVAASSAPRQVLLENLKKGEEKYRDVAGLEGVAHLQLWRKVLAPEEE